MSFWFAANKATVDVLSTVSSASTVVSETATAVAELATTARIHAESFRKTTELALDMSSKEGFAVAKKKAMHSITRQLIALDEEAQDPRFAAMLAKVEKDYAAWEASQRPAVLVAAE